MCGLKLLVGQTNFMLIVFLWIQVIFFQSRIKSSLNFLGIPGRFDRNGFTMNSKSISLTFYSKQDDVTPEQLRDSLQVRSYKISAVET